MWKRALRRKSLLAILIVAGMLAVTATTFAGFATTAGAAALKQPYGPPGATGTGVNAPPLGSEPLIPDILWDAKNYRIPHHAASCPQPPANLADRLALVNSPTILDYFGLPRLAPFKGDIARWQENITHAQTHTCDSNEPIVNGLPITNTILYPNNYWGGYGSHCTSGCWSYQAADTQFTVPSFATSYFTKDSIWVGTGGTDHYEALSQDGVSQLSDFYVNFNDPFYESEACGHSGEQDLSYHANTGDVMYVYTDVYGNDTVDDYTQGKYFSTTWGCSTSDAAEFIVERNGYDQGTPLAHFQPVVWHHAEFEDSSNTWYRVDALGSYLWVLQNNSNQPLVTVSGVGVDSGYGSTFTYYWQRGS